VVRSYGYDAWHRLRTVTDAMTNVVITTTTTAQQSGVARAFAIGPGR
jgi:hypothetical protein